MRRTFVLLLAGALVAGGVAACRSEKQAQLVVVVHSDMAVPGELDAFRAHVTGPQGEVALDRSFTLGPGQVELPTDFGVAPLQGDVRRRVTIAIDAIHGNETLFTTTAVTTFLPRRRLRVDMFLARACVERAALCDPNETCRREGCVVPEIDPTELPDFDPGESWDIDAAVPPDAGVDAAADAGVDAAPDAGVGPQPSCAALLAAMPGSPSGNYTITPVGGQPVDVYCEMEMFGGGWTRTAVVDASTGVCAGDWVLTDPPGACTRPYALGASQSDAIFSSPQGAFTEVMGWVQGLQESSMDSFAPYFDGATVADYYVDGVAIMTTEATPQHLWTYVVAWSDDDNREFTLCPCLGGEAAPPFVGADFYCESGTTGTPWGLGWFVNDPLWDGDGTGSNCDTPANPSVFHRVLAAPVEADVRVRLQADQSSDNEDVGITGFEIYVR